MKLVSGKPTVDVTEVPKVPPSCWSAFPECLIEDLTDFVIFISQQLPHLIREAFDQSPSLPDFLSLMVCSPTFFRNPYLGTVFTICGLLTDNYRLAVPNVLKNKIKHI